MDSEHVPIQRSFPSPLSFSRPCSIISTKFFILIPNKGHNSPMPLTLYWRNAKDFSLHHFNHLAPLRNYSHYIQVHELVQTGFFLLVTRWWRRSLPLYIRPNNDATSFRSNIKSTKSWCWYDPHKSCVEKPSTNDLNYLRECLMAAESILDSLSFLDLDHHSSQGSYDERNDCAKLLYLFM